MFERLQNSDETSVVDVEVLGHIFEQSITDLEELQAELASGEVAKRGKPLGRRRREGVFYTPDFVTSYIVERALSPVLAARSEGVRSRAHAALCDNVA